MTAEHTPERMPVDVEHLRSRADDMHAGGLIVQAAEMRGAADEIERLQAEVATLQRWKAEAATVLGYWENAYERAQIPGHLGEFKPTVMLAEIEQLRGAITLACSGWKNPDGAVAYWLRKAGEAAASSTSEVQP